MSGDKEVVMAGQGRSRNGSLVSSLQVPLSAGAGSIASGATVMPNGEVVMAGNYVPAASASTGNQNCNGKECSDCLSSLCQISTIMVQMYEFQP